MKLSEQLSPLKTFVKMNRLVLSTNVLLTKAPLMLHCLLIISSQWSNGNGNFLVFCCLRHVFAHVVNRCMHAPAKFCINLMCLGMSKGTRSASLMNGTVCHRQMNLVLGTMTTTKSTTVVRINLRLFRRFSTRWILSWRRAWISF